MIDSIVRPFRRSGRLALLSFLIAAAAPRLEAQVAPGDSAALLAITQRLLDAVTSGDSSVWARHTSSGWFMTDEEGGHVGRADFLGGLRGLPPGQSGRLQLASPRLAGAPGTVVVSYDIDEQHDLYGQQLRTRFHATDTWVRGTGGAWTMLASQVTALPTPIAGRRVERRILDEYAGSYSLTPEIGLRVVADDSGVAIVRGSRPPQRLYALDDRIFIIHGVRGFWLFERDQRGAVARLVNWRDNNPVVWTRKPVS